MMACAERAQRRRASRAGARHLDVARADRCACVAGLKLGRARQ